MTARIAIIGDSPATYVCAIYLKTANIPPYVFQLSNGNDWYSCTYVPGVYTDGKEDFNQKCHEQAKNMNITVEKANDISVIYNVADDDILGNYEDVIKNKKYFVVREYIELPEAVVVAGSGCEIAFRIKEQL